VQMCPKYVQMGLKKPCGMYANVCNCLRTFSGKSTNCTTFTSLHYSQHVHKEA